MGKYKVVITRFAELVIVDADNLIDAKNKAIEEHPESDWVSVTKLKEEEN